ncbi:GFA family protein [Reinekea sp. G2M2-21]|uniref:GFA family protein n=1 Tax=Reinekea sp. G2M2-21 TaxID=2788942 RepID=UPI0018A90E36|nr:GFA family protein [Reinekea sp. G2M2-21]
MKTYQGHCHCGSVTFEVTANEPITSGVRCNCSLCRRKAAVMVIVDNVQFKLTGGQDALSEYQWNTKLAHHYFCSKCGIYTHHQPRTMQDKIGFNAACVDELEPLTFDIDIRNGQGLSLES